MIATELAAIVGAIFRTGPLAVSPMPLTVGGILFGGALIGGAVLTTAAALTRRIVGERGVSFRLLTAAAVPAVLGVLWLAQWGSFSTIRSDWIVVGAALLLGVCGVLRSRRQFAVAAVGVVILFATAIAIEASDVGGVLLFLFHVHLVKSAIVATPSVAAAGAGSRYVVDRFGGEN